MWRLFLPDLAATLTGRVTEKCGNLEDDPEQIFHMPKLLLFLVSETIFSIQKPIDIYISFSCSAKSVVFPHLQLYRCGIVTPSVLIIVCGVRRS